MKQLFSFVFFIFCFTVVVAQSSVSALIPMPSRVEKSDKGEAFFALGNLSVWASNGLDFEVDVLTRIVDNRMGIKAIKGASAKKAQVKLTLVDKNAMGREGYRLRVTSRGVEVEASDAAGIYYGLMTFDQILLGDAFTTSLCSIDAIEVDDAPRFEHRALMIDPARHFLPVDGVLAYIDNMSRYKFNKLQIHLTDDQGWRIEIKKHPKLASADHYTQDQLRAIVRYAADRHIEVIPELDMPGHSVALLYAYPDLGCTATDTMAKVVGTTTNMMLCCNNEKVYQVVDDIIAEVAQVFESDKIHLGGDEAAVQFNWAKCDRCLTLMRQKNYVKPSDLMNVFFGKVCRSVERVGKVPMLWCELDNICMPANDYLFEYQANVVLTTWRYGLTPKCIELTGQHGHKLIVAPGEHSYFDYPQYKGDLPEYNNWGMSILTLEQAYSLDPGYGLAASDQAHIIGVCGTLWGEAILDINRLNYMTYPRALALAEAGWSPMSVRGWRSFVERLYPNLSDLMRRGVPFRVPFEVVAR